MPAAPLPLMGLNLSAGNGIDARWRESISISAEKYRHAARQWVSLRRIWHSLRGYRASPSPNGKPGHPIQRRIDPSGNTGRARRAILGKRRGIRNSERRWGGNLLRFPEQEIEAHAEHIGNLHQPVQIRGGLSLPLLWSASLPVGRFPLLHSEEKPMPFWVSRNVPQYRFPGFRNVPPACRKRSLLNPPLPVSRRPLYALPVPMIPDFMVPIFGLSCAVPPRYAVSCCS